MHHITLQHTTTHRNTLQIERAKQQQPRDLNESSKHHKLNESSQHHELNERAPLSIRTRMLVIDEHRYASNCILRRSDGVLRRVAVGCRVLQSVAECCSVFQCLAVCCSML